MALPWPSFLLFIIKDNISSVKFEWEKVLIDLVGERRKSYAERIRNPLA